MGLEPTLRRTVKATFPNTTDFIFIPKHPIKNNWCIVHGFYQVIIKVYDDVILTSASNCHAMAYLRSFYRVCLCYFLCISIFLDNYKVYIFFLLCNILNCCFYVMSQSLFPFNLGLASLVYV